jgi:tetratricopeptide (TPR) repeat protein
MILRLSSAALIATAMACAAQPDVNECFKVRALLKMDQDHYWANWANECPYTIDSVYVAVQFSDRSGGRLGDSVWAMHFLPPGTHRVTRLTAPREIDDFESVGVLKITSSSDEALLHLPPASKITPVKIPDRPRPVVAAATVPRAEAVSAEEHHRRGRELIRDRNYRAAIAELSEAIREKPNFPAAFNARGFARYMSREYRPALDDLDQAIRLNPTYLNAYQNRRQVRKASGDLAGSAADARTIRELSGNSR